MTDSRVPAVHTTPPCRDPAASEIYVRILGGFDLIVMSRPVLVGASSRRVLALLATNGGKISRMHAARMLWPEVSQARASANLRSALWRLHKSCPEVVIRMPLDFRLADNVMADIGCVQATARRLLDHSARLSEESLSWALGCNLYDDILPELADQEWLEAEAEQHRQMRLHALEALAERFIRIRRYGAAVEAALSALSVDPFRESACIQVVKAYLAEGNQLAARRQCERYCTMLREDLQLEPSPALRQFLNASAQRKAALRGRA